MTKTANISAAGVLVHVEQQIAVGSKVDVRIDFFEGVSFECWAKVVRCVDDGNIPATYSVAISFEGLDETKVAFLKSLVLTLFGFEKKT